MVHFTRACKTLLSENNKTRLTFEKQQEKNKNIICRPWSVRIEKNCALGLEHGPRPAASDRTDSRALAQFFSIRTSRPANNIYIFDRIPSNHLDDTRPIKANMEDLENKEYLLSKAELDKMKSDFTILVTRVLVQFFPCLSYLKDDVCKHIPHR